MYTHHVEHEIEKHIDILYPHGEGNAPRARVERALQHIGEVAFEAGRMYALGSLLTTEDLARMFGVTVRRIRARAQLLQRFGVGFKTPRGDWLFTPEEIEIMRPGSPGRPARTQHKP